MTCARDFDVIRNQKYQAKKKEHEGKRSQRANVADELLEVIGMIDKHPFVQTILHNKNKVPTIICYTESQIKDLKSFLSTAKGQPLGIDRIFNLGCLYVQEPQSCAKELKCWRKSNFSWSGHATQRCDL